DAFDDVGVSPADFSGLHIFEVERTDGIDADNLDLRILFFKEATDAADGAASAHAADEMRDLALRVLPDLGARGAIVGLGIHGVVVLIGVKGIGDFTGQFLGHGIVAARIIGLDGGGADNHFGTKALEEIDFLLRLFIGNCEDHLIAADGGDERQAHAGIAGGAFDDGAGGLEETLALGFVDHGNPDAVLDRTAGIQVIGFDVDLGFAVAGDTIEANDRRMTDGFEDGAQLHALIDSAVYHAAMWGHANAASAMQQSTMRKVNGRGGHETDQYFVGNDVGADCGVFAGGSRGQCGARLGHDGNGRVGKHRGRGQRL